MSKADTRLEILKLVNRHDQQPDFLISRAKMLEAYLYEEETQKVEPSPKGKGNFKKDKEDNSILS